MTNSNMHLLLTGDSGAGKDTFAATFPKPIGNGETKELTITLGLRFEEQYTFLI